MPGKTNQVKAGIEASEVFGSSEMVNDVLKSLPDANKAFQAKAKNVEAVIGETEEVSVREAAKHKPGQTATSKSIKRP